MIAHLQAILALLKAQAVLYQTAHWQVAGPQSYAEHLLFERLYGNLGEEIDTLAEKMVGYGGPEAVDPQIIEQMVLGCVTRATGIEDFFARMLRLEEALQHILTAVASPEAEEPLPIGLTDFLNGMASDHESHLYLLKQGSRPAFGRTASTAEGYFFDSPKRREVLEFSESEALSNSEDVVLDAVASYEVDGGARSEVQKAQKAPPTPDEILDSAPATGQFSTLSRFLVETEQPTHGSVPEGWEDLPKQRMTLKDTP
jgi:DNA-binding ferritin-like protein